MATKLAAGFLAGATSRLLPASIPLRFFGAAVACQLLAWLALLGGSVNLPRFAGGLGWTLAALHLVTLGVLVMTAIGASLQLLPVATRQPVRSMRGPVLVWWLYAPGVAAIALGMGLARPWLLAGGASAVMVALLVYAALLAQNLAGARGMPVVVAHGWTALVSLLVTLLTAFSLAFTYVGMPLLDRGTGLALHVLFAAYGFMGMLALGLSYILVPMFALSAAPHEKRALASWGLAILALALAAAAALGVAPRALRIGAVLAAAIAITLHLRLMTVALKTGMRRELGRSFRLVRISWALLALSLLLALALAVDLPFEGMPTLFGLVLIAGWLLTFLLGILQRIVPFLASMHMGRSAAGGPLMSEIAGSQPLKLHAACHVLALALVAAGIAGDAVWLVRLGSAAGLAGALAYGWFMAGVARRVAVRDP